MITFQHVILSYLQLVINPATQNSNSTKGPLNYAEVSLLNIIIMHILVLFKDRPFSVISLLDKINEVFMGVIFSYLNFNFFLKMFKVISKFIGSVCVCVHVYACVCV